jgi:hypothetical protein
VRKLTTPAITGVLLFAESTGAAADPSVAWSVSVDPPECDADRFAREVTLACDAMGQSCRLAEDPASADRRAILRCPSDGPWSLEVRDGASNLRWVLPLDGDDRTRQAAVWISRTPPALPPQPAAPPEAAPAAGSPSPPVATPARVTDSPPSAGAPSTAESTRWRTPFGVLAAARTSLGSGFGPAIGGEVRTGVTLGRTELAVDVSGAAEHGLSSPGGYSYTAENVGAGLVYGAPWGHAPLGLALEGGALFGEIQAPVWSSPPSRSFVHGYFSVSCFAQWPMPSALRPFAVLSGAVQTATVQVNDNGAGVVASSRFSASLGVGVAWRPW